MRVLHIIDSGGLYGAEVMLLNLVAEQIKLGIQPVIASIGEKGIAEKPLEREGVRRGFEVKKFRMAPGPNLAGMLNVLRYAQKHEFDLLHSHGYKGDVAFGFLPRRLRKIPLVSTLHGWTSTNGFSKNSVYEWLQRKSLKSIDAVVLVHGGMLSNSKLQKVRNVKFHVVNNGIALDSTYHLPIIPPSDALDTKIADFCAKSLTIGSIGRLSPEKDYSSLIEAIHILKRKGNPIRLVIVGEGPEGDRLEKRVSELGIGDLVLLPGDRANARDCLPLFKAFALSSLTEGLPMTLLEAMQAGVPIVATIVGGIPEVLGHGQSGVLVPAQRPECLADAIKHLFDNPAERERLGCEGQRIVREKYSSRRMAERYSEIYAGLIQKRAN